MDIHRTIKVLRNRLGLTQRDLASAVGVSQGMVSQWETGRSAPELAKIPLLAATLEVSEQELIGGFEARDTASAAPEHAALPTPAVFTPYIEGLEQALAHATSLESIIIKAQAAASVPLVTLGRANASSSGDERLMGYSVEVPTSVLEAHPAAQAVVIEGNYIDRVAPSGAIAVFDPNLEPSNGRIVIVETGDHQALIRRWHKGNTTITLYADSHLPYPDIILTMDEPVRVVGTVIKVIVPDEML